MKENALPQFARDQMAREQHVAAGVHPDPDVLTAFCEGALLDQERTRVMDHIARCGDCREVVFLAAPDALSQSAPAAATVVPVVVKTAPWWKRLMPAMATAAAVIVVGSAVLLHREEAAQKQAIALPATASVPESTASTAVPAAATDSKALKQAPAVRSRAAQPAKENPPLDVPARTEQAQAGVLNQAVAAGPHGQVAAKGSGSNYQNLAVTPAPASPAASTVRVAPGPRGDIEAKGNAYFAQNAAPPIQLQNAPAVPTAPAAPAQLAKKSEAAGKAKVTSDQTAQMAEMSTAEMNKVQSRSTDSFSDKIASGRQDAVLASSVRGRSHWRIDEDGELQSSHGSDGWKPALVGARARFRVVSVVGNDVWAGGSDGMLYHSLDGGEHWKHVEVAANGHPLFETITSIKFHDMRNGTLTTESGTVWETKDGGAHWSKK